MTEFFSPLTFHQISRKAVEIFEPVFTLGQNLTKKLIEHNTDSLGVLMCVRLNQRSAFELQRRKVPVADSYVNGINMQLWPRFQVIMDLHAESLKRVGSNTGRSAVSALSIAGGDDLKNSSAPHFLTQRFGQLMHGILVLSSDAGDDEPVSNSLARLRTEFDAMLAKLSRNGTDAKRRERFLFNNYSLILTIISVCLVSPSKVYFGKCSSETGYPRQISSRAETGQSFKDRRRYSILTGMQHMDGMLKNCSKR